MSVALRLDDEIDISRGDMIVEAEDQPVSARELEAMVCWMSEQPLQPARPLRDQAHDPHARARSSSRSSTASTSTRSSTCPPPSSALNEIGRVRLRCSAPLVVDPYARNRTTGSFILIDEATNDTVAAGMVVSAAVAPGSRRPSAPRPVKCAAACSRRS